MFLFTIASPYFWPTYVIQSLNWYQSKLKRYIIKVIINQRKHEPALANISIQQTLFLKTTYLHICNFYYFLNYISPNIHGIVSSGLPVSNSSKNVNVEKEAKGVIESHHLDKMNKQCKRKHFSGSYNDSHRFIAFDIHKMLHLTW